MTAAILEARSITKRFGGLTANEDVSLVLPGPVGQVISVIGPNGAGKSTFFKMLSGFLKPSSGQVLLHGQDITGMPPHRIAKLGLVRTFQETTIFPDLTAMEHVSLAHQLHREGNDLEVVLGLPRARGDEIRLGTDPFRPDSDLDGWSDALEVEAGSDPLDPASRPAQVYVARPPVLVALPASAADLPPNVTAARPPVSVEIEPTP